MAAAKAVWRSSSGGGDRREPAWILGFKPKRTNLHEKYDYPYGRVAGILLTGHALRFDKVVAVLEARYGAAPETIKGAERTRVGIEAPALTKRWRGDRVTIEAVSPFGRPDQFTVYWSDVATQGQRDAQRARDSERLARKL